MALVAGAKAKGADFQNLEVKKHDDTAQGTFTSTTFTPTRASATSPIGVAFTAPPSGKVKIHWRASLFNNGAGFTACSFRILSGTTLGSGASFQGFSDNTAIQNTGTSNRPESSSSLVIGLTPGNDYNVTLGYRVSSGEGTAFRIEVIVDPCIA